VSEGPSGIEDGKLIRRTSCIRIRGDFGCSFEHGRGESGIRERFRGSRDETEIMFYAGMSYAHLSIHRYPNLVAVDERVSFVCTLHSAGVRHLHPVRGSTPAVPFV
jgi:hypothetical protein